MGGFKRSPGDSDVQPGRVERLLQTRAAHSLMYAQITGDLVKMLTNSAALRSGEPKILHY